MDKKEVRKYIRDLKKGYSLEEKQKMSGDVWKQMEENPYFKEAKIVLAYWSMDDEVYTHKFLSRWTGKKVILLPCVKGDDLEFRYFEGIDKLQPGESYHISEPVGCLFTDLSQIDLIIIPGVAFDKSRNRLGRGKGYYDRLLKDIRSYKIGVCFDFQYLDEIPTDENDVKMDLVIC